jgi:carbon storage regulator CsrA
MLVLSRKQSQSIQIDSSIQITVISVSQGRVKLGITAPDHVRIVRNELLVHDASAPSQSVNVVERASDR